MPSRIFDLFPVALASIAAAIARDNFEIVRETLIFGINGSHLRFALMRLFPHWFSLNRTTRRPAEQCDERRFLSARSLGTSAVTLLVSTSVYGVNVYGTRAEPAYHCSPGQIYRVSKNICVPKQSAMSLQNGSSTGEGKPATEKTSSGLRGSVSGARNAEHAPRISSPSSPAKVGEPAADVPASSARRISSPKEFPAREEPAADVSSGTQSRMSGAANASRTPRVSVPHRSGREGAGRRPTAEDFGGAQVRGAAGVSVALPDVSAEAPEHVNAGRGSGATAAGGKPTAEVPPGAQSRGRGVASVSFAPRILSVPLPRSRPEGAGGRREAEVSTGAQDHVSGAWSASTPPIGFPLRIPEAEGKPTEEAFPGAAERREWYGQRFPRARGCVTE